MHRKAHICVRPTACGSEQYGEIPENEEELKEALVVTGEGRRLLRQVEDMENAAV